MRLFHKLISWVLVLILATAVLPASAEQSPEPAVPSPSPDSTLPILPAFVIYLLYPTPSCNKLRMGSLRSRHAPNIRQGHVPARASTTVS